MNEEKIKNLQEHLDGLRAKVGLTDFMDETSDGEFKDIPVPQHWKDIDAFEFDPDRWLVENMLPREGITIIASISGVGKSLVAGHLSKCLSTGTNLFGNPKFPVKKSKVLLINLEMSISEVQRRGRLIGFESENENLIMLNEDNFNLNKLGLQDYTYRWLLDFLIKEKIEVLIIDTFRPATGGMREEKAEEVRNFFQKFLILKNSGVSVIFLEHLRKPTQQEGKVPKKEQLLGSQDKTANVEILLMLAKDERSGETRIYQRKNRLGPEMKPYAIKIEDGFTTDNEKTLLFNYIGEINDDVNKKEEAKELIRDILSDGDSKTTNQLIELTKKIVGAKNVREALREMKKQEEVNTFKTGRQDTFVLPREKIETPSEMVSPNEADKLFEDF